MLCCTRFFGVTSHLLNEYWTLYFAFVRITNFKTKAIMVPIELCWAFKKRSAVKAMLLLLFQNYKVQEYAGCSHPNVHIKYDLTDIHYKPLVHKSIQTVLWIQKIREQRMTLKKNSLQTNQMFVKKQAAYLSINIDQIQFLTFIFADGRAAQMSTKDTYSYSECQTRQLCPSYYRNSTVVAAQGINHRNHHKCLIITFQR